MRKKKETEHHFHEHNYDVGKIMNQLFSWMIIILLVATLTNLIGAPQESYRNCVNACSERSVMGVKEGVDSNENNCFVEEYDRSWCMESCNEMYLKLNRVED